MQPTSFVKFGAAFVNPAQVAAVVQDIGRSIVFVNGAPPFEVSDHKAEQIIDLLSGRPSTPPPPKIVGAG